MTFYGTSKGGCPEFEKLVSIFLAIEMIEMEGCVNQLFIQF